VTVAVDPRAALAATARLHTNDPRRPALADAAEQVAVAVAWTTSYRCTWCRGPAQVVDLGHGPVVRVAHALLCRRATGA